MLVPTAYTVFAGQQPAYDAFFAAVRAGDIDRVRDSLTPPLNLDTLLVIDDGYPPIDGFSNGETALHMASRAGHAEIVALLLSQGAHVDPRSIRAGVASPPSTPLFDAAYYTHVAVVQTLLEHGADITVVGEMHCNAVHNILLDKEEVVPEYFQLLNLFIKFGQDLNAIAMDVGDTVLHQAVELGNFELIRLLLDNGAELHRLSYYGHVTSPLSVAVRLRNFATTRYLLECGAEVDESALIAAHGIEMLEFLCQHADQNLIRNSKTLHKACGSYWLDRDIIKFFLRMQVDLEIVDDQGDTPLLHACGGGDAPPDVIELLLRHGANLLARRIQTGRSTDGIGDTALHRAAMYIRPRTFQLLLAAGVDVNAVNEKGQTALMRCASSMGWLCALPSSSQVVQTDIRLKGLLTLKNAGADGALRDHLKRNALHYLALGNDNRGTYHRRPAVAEILLQAGADPKAVDADGKTPIDLFAKVCDHEMVAFLSRQECTE